MGIEMNAKIKKEWQKFIAFVREKHQLTDDWIPYYYSIKLWEEYKDAKVK